MPTTIFLEKRPKIFLVPGGKIEVRAVKKPASLVFILSSSSLTLSPLSSVSTMSPRGCPYIMSYVLQVSECQLSVSLRS
eukprot:g40940.t1